MTKIGIFIPCYNVANSIRDVLGSFTQETLLSIHEIVVVDNCSTDDTPNILKEIQSRQDLLARRLVIIRNSANYGLGGSQKIAYSYFQHNGFSHFMIIHGDNQGDGEQIAKSFLGVFKQKPNVDFIIASRFAKNSDHAGYNRMRVVGNLVFNFLTFVCTGHRMSDSGAAILFYRTAILDRIPFDELTNSFQFNPQLNIMLYNLKDLNIEEVPMLWRDSKDKSNITAFKYCLTMLKILLRYRWNKTVLRKESWQMFHQDSQRIQPVFQIIRPAV